MSDSGRPGQNDLSAQPQIAELTEDGDRRADVQFLAAPENLPMMGHGQGRFTRNRRICPIPRKRREFSTQSWLLGRTLITPLLDRFGVEARVTFVLFVHDLLPVRRGDLKKAAVGQWQIGSFQPAIDDRN